MTASAAYHYMFILIISVAPILLVAAWRARLVGTPFLDFINLRTDGMSPARLAVYGVLTVVGTILLRSLVEYWMSGPPIPGAEPYRAPTTVIMRSMVQVLPFTSFIFGMVIGALEELIHRGWLMKEVLLLCKRSEGTLADPAVAQVVAVISTATLFAAMHGSLTLMASFMTVGLVFGAVRFCTNSVIPSLIAHMLMNGLAGLTAMGWI